MDPINQNIPIGPGGPNQPIDQTRRADHVGKAFEVEGTSPASAQPAPRDMSPEAARLFERIRPHIAEGASRETIARELVGAELRAAFGHNVPAEAIDHAARRMLDDPNFRAMFNRIVNAAMNWSQRSE